MKTYRQIYMTENEAGEWVVNPEITERCRELSTENDRSYPGYGCYGWVYFTDEVNGDELRIKCIRPEDPRMKDIPMVFVEKTDNTGTTRAGWFPPDKYVEGKKCTTPTGWFVFGKLIKEGTAADRNSDFPYALSMFGGCAAACAV